MIILDNYEYSTRDSIGNGSFARVFKGRMRKDHSKLIAVKVIEKKVLVKSQNLLDKEIKILRELTKLNHKNVVALLDFKQYNEDVCLIMEYCNGGDLAGYLHKKQTLSEDTIRLFVAQLAEAMKAFFQKGIVHRDLKPQNILLSYSKPNPQPADIVLKVADFGFARFLQDGKMAATLCGSPMYMAPEVIMSLEYDAKADLWSIGTIVFQCLTGCAPFVAPTPAVLKQIYEDKSNLVAPIPPGTSPALRDLILQLLKRDAKERISFVDFFNHKFLQPPEPLNMSDMGDRLPSLPGICDSPPGRARIIMRSPSITSRICSRSPTPTSSPRFIRETTQHASPLPLSSSPEDDFVLVSSHFSLEHSIEDRYTKASAKTVQNVEQIESPSRPSYLPISEPVPVPVPSQKAAYEQMLKKGQMLSTQDLSGSKLQSNGSIPRSQPINVKNSENKNIQNGIDIASLSPPSVQFVIGTPPGGGRRRSITNSLCESPPPTIWQVSPMSNVSPPVLSGPLARIPILSSPNLLDNNNLQKSPVLPFGTRARTLPEISEIGNYSLFSDNCHVMDTPVTFLAPELPEETLLDSKHNEVLAKINFILSVSCCVLDLAATRNSTSLLTNEVALKSQPKTDTERKVEKFVLLYRALEFLRCGLSLAEQQLRAGSLRRSNTVVQVITALHARYRSTFAEFKQLCNAGIAAMVGPKNVLADKILYTYAVNMCESASVEELYGFPENCFQRYEIAHILFHSLAQHIQDQEDKALLTKYKEAVETRLHLLKERGVIYTTDLKLSI